MDKPQYPCAPIGTIEILAKTLGFHPKKLIAIANKVDTSYSEHQLPAHPTTGKIRTVLEAKRELKTIQKRINSRIFEHVKFPIYLQGGIKATSQIKRDYVANAKFHSRSQTLINLDVRNFYPNIKADSVRDIFRYFFKFSNEVVEILTTLTTYKGSLPQGGCTSSYLANLIFFNDEYRIVSSLRGRGLRYSRLLDDITISSTNDIDVERSTQIIKSVAAMLKKRNLSLKSAKTKVSDRSEMHKDFEVTGLCVRLQDPKVRKKDRMYIRSLVFECEKMAVTNRTSEDFHTLWNKTSGLVAKLHRLKHSQSTGYRKRLSVILPLYDEYQEDKVIKRAKSALKVPICSHNLWGIIKRYNTIIYCLGILARTQSSKAKIFRKALKAHYSTIPTINAYWEK